MEKVLGIKHRQNLLGRREAGPQKLGWRIPQVNIHTKKRQNRKKTWNIILCIPGIVLVRPPADFCPFSTNFWPLWDQHKSAKMMDLYVRGRPPRKGQNSSNSAQNSQFQPHECSVRTIPDIHIFQPTCANALHCFLPAIYKTLGQWKYISFEKKQLQRHSCFIYEKKKSNEKLSFMCIANHLVLIDR